MAFWGCSSFIPCILALFAHFIPCILPLFVRFIPCILSLFVINSVKSRHLEDTMKRDLLDKLSVWKTHPLRMPLILRGARQVGKSWLVQEFGKQFQTFISINFDKEEAAKTLFSPNINIPKLLEKIAIYAGKKITAGETLLFLDEIQECEIALKALRYFKEEYPQLHVIATGSLIDFALEKIDMPVGRIEYLYLKALSFGEFLTVNGEDYLRNALMEEKVDVSIHGKLNELLKNYFWLGGMPAVVDTWLQYKDPAYCQAMQDRILISYIQDFEKYARKNQIANVEKVFNTIPEQLGQKFKSSRIDSEIKSLQIKNALELLVKAGVAYKCYHTSGQGLPLSMNKNYDKFKVYFFDIGLVQRLLKVDLQQWITSTLNINFIGSIAEQFVAQELVAYSEPSLAPELYYWRRESKSSNAQVDFIVSHKGSVVPIEVKSATQGGMKSLRIFLEEHNKSAYGLKISEGYYAKQPTLVEIPFYGIESWVNI